MAGKNQGGGGFAALFAESETPVRRRRARVGDEVTAKVVAITGESVFVDMGAKAEGLIDRHELTEDGELTVKIGDEVTARVVSHDGGTMTLRIRAGRGDGSGAALQEAFQLGLPVSGQISAVNKGGVEVTIGSTRAFCPVSQLDMHFVEDPSQFVGQTHEFKITRLEEGRGGVANAVVSRRALLEEEAAKKLEAIRGKLEVGAVLPGKVTSLRDYGAFVDLGGVEGMLHISELSFARVEHPSEVLSVGDEIEAQITKVEETGDKRRPLKIGLSLKALQAHPWDAAIDKLKPGQRHTGEVVRLEQFGGFVKLPGGLEGLVHISEIGAGRRLNHARDALKVGQKVEVVITAIDHDRKRVSLSMKAVSGQREAEDAASYKGSGGGMGTFADLFNAAKKSR